jgi:putative acetyltransferase
VTTAPDFEPSRSSQPTIEVVEAQAEEHFGWVRTLFLEYQSDIGVDLCFQGFAEELAALPGDYQPPYGRLLLALVEGAPAGCCAFRPLLDSDHANACEMKRLFVRPAYRGLGIGRLLVDQTLLHAQQAGYNAMLLDTLSDMEAARALYAESGFEEVAPYYHNPLPGAHYLRVVL